MRIDSGGRSAAFAVLVVLAGLLQIVGGAPASVADETAPLRVMPLGDSITEGYDASTLGADGGYRTDLWQLFKADGRAVDLVGARSSGPSRLGDRDHEGHGGWRVDQIAGGEKAACGAMSGGNVTAWLASARPDAVLLHIGTNDIAQRCALGTNAASLADRLAKLIDYIVQAAPAAHLYVAKIVPFTEPAANALGNAYNARIPGIVQARAAAGKKVHLVDMNSAVPPADITDKLHPSTGGYSKMAARWYGALTSSPMGRWEAEAATSTFGGAFAIDTVNASGQRKVGHIDGPGSFVQLRVDAATAGPYRLYVRAGNGTGATCTHRLAVNGGDAGELAYPSHGWDQWGIVPADVWLKAGANAVRLSGATCYAEVDSIDVTPGLAMYPRAIRLAHSGDANGRVIASLNTSSTGGLTDMARFYESADDGKTFQPIGEVRDPQAGSGRGACCGSLFELPSARGQNPAGTLLWATTVGMANAPARQPAIRVWKSLDHGRTWSYLSSCATAAGTLRPSEGLWEPELSVDSQGDLTCYFSDETRYPQSAEKSTQVISAVTSSDGGATWGARRPVVDLGVNHRPGMPGVRRLPDGRYLMAYELCGSAQSRACEVHVRTSSDGRDWGAAAQAGPVPKDLDGNSFFHAPTIAWAPGPGTDGRVLLVGGLVKDPSGKILLDASGKTVYANAANGTGNWFPIDAPVKAPFSSTTPGGEEVVCTNYSSSLLPSADGTQLLEIATKRIGDPQTGRCTAVFGTAPARGTGDSTGVDPAKAYRLRDLATAKCVDAGAGSDPLAADMQQWACNDLPRQNWKFTTASSGRFTVVNQRSGKCLDLVGGSAEPGAAVQQSPCSGSGSQTWRVSSTGRGHYTLASGPSGLCLAPAGDSGADGAKIQQSACDGRASQIWRAEVR
ncbi:RICIN domain-containing protein [Actinomadura rubrisoli]|uniref:CBM6 domain-containing protein n=1 Tax=Actinomadura rubrisoli TaxID=2530368 RepID=A0A4R5BE10_9ACTN|nr:RICIN domain-containing protein [Actinomadura rubrisoli]TDD81822.1 hypothetical protein E1298_23565 [Actinomadura rubrisoli]